MSVTIGVDIIKPTLTEAQTEAATQASSVIASLTRTPSDLICRPRAVIRSEAVANFSSWKPFI